MNSGGSSFRRCNRSSIICLYNTNDNDYDYDNSNTNNEKKTEKKKTEKKEKKVRSSGSNEMFH